MALRLPHILVLMALVLGAGVVSVAILAPGASVPGVVILDAPWAGDHELAALAADLGGVVQRLPTAGDLAAAGPLGPFDPAWAAARAARGDLTALYSLDPRLRREQAGTDAAGRPAWRVVVDSLPGLAPDARVDWAVASARDLLVAQGGTRPFAVGLALDPGTPPAAAGSAGPTHRVSVARPLPDVVAPLVEALSGLPSYRRSTLVVLGGHHHDGPDDDPDDGKGRLVLRIDRGPGGQQGAVPPALADLLETRP